MLISSGLCSEITKILEDDIGMDLCTISKSNDNAVYEKMYAIFIDYLLPRNCSNSKILREMHFEISFVALAVCKHCKIVNKRVLVNSIPSLASENMDKASYITESLFRSNCNIISQNTDMLKCNCEMPVEIHPFVLSLPSTLLFFVDTPKNCILPKQINLENTLDTCMPLDRYHFDLKALYQVTGEHCEAFVKENDEFISSVSGKSCSVPSLKSLNMLLLFYTKRVNIFEPMKILNETNVDYYAYQEIELDANSQEDTKPK